MTSIIITAIICISIIAIIGIICYSDFRIKNNNNLKHIHNKIDLIHDKIDKHMDYTNMIITKLASIVEDTAKEKQKHYE